MTGKRHRTTRVCLPGRKHAWRLVDPKQPTPRTLVCDVCGKHAPPQPGDSDYDTWENE